MRSDGGAVERNSSILMESSLKDSAVELDPASAVSGGVHDLYGEDRATEDHFVTPWTVSVAR